MQAVPQSGHAEKEFSDPCKGEEIWEQLQNQLNCLGLKKNVNDSRC